MIVESVKYSASHFANYNPIDLMIDLLQFKDYSFWGNFLTLALWLALGVGLICLAVSWLEEFWYLGNSEELKDQDRDSKI